MTASVTEIKMADGLPTRITVELDIAEALVIARAFGKFTGSNFPMHNVWECLVGEVFNRFWEDGVNGASIEIDSGVLGEYKP